MSDLHPILRALRKIRTSEKRWICLFSFSSFLTIAIVTWLLVGLTDFYWRSELFVVRVLLSSALFVVVIFSAWKLLWPAIRFRRELVDVARAIESSHPEQRPSLSLAADFLSGTDVNGSARLREKLIQSAEQDLDSVLSASPVRADWPIRAIMAFVAVAVLASSLVLINPGESLIAFRRSLSPFSGLAWPSFNDLEFQDAPEKLALGDSFECRIVDLNGRLPKTVRLEIDDGTSTLVRQMHVENAVAFFEISNVTRPLWIRASGGDDQTAWHRVNVVAAPRVKELEISVRPPSYTGLAEYSVGPFEKIWSGSQISLEGQSDKTLQKTEFVFDSGIAEGQRNDSTSVRINAKQIGQHRFKFPGTTFWHLDKTLLFQIHLTGKDRLVGGKSRSYRIPARKDEPPVAELSFPNERRMFGPKDNVPIRLNASDDLQIRSVSIVIQDLEKQRAKFDLDLESQQPLPATSTERNEVLKDFNIQLAKTIANPGNGEFRIVAEVTDAKGQASKSEPIVFRIGTESELTVLESKLKQELFQTLRTILEKQTHSQNLTSLILKDSEPNNLSNHQTRIAEIANAQRLVEAGLYGTEGVAEKCLAYGKYGFNDVDGNVSNEIAAVRLVLRRIQPSVQAASSQASQAFAFTSNHGVALTSLRETASNQSIIVNNLESLVGKIDVQGQLQKCQADIRRLIEQQTTIGEQCLQLQSQSVTNNRGFEVSRTRLLNEQNGITNQLNELGWSLLEQSRNLKSPELERLGQELKVIEIDSKKAATQISKVQLGLAYQSITRVLEQLKETLNQTAIAGSPNQQASREQIDQARSGLNDIQKAHSELAGQLGEWKELNESQRNRVLNKLRTFRQQMAEFRDRNREMLSERSETLLQETEQLLQNLLENLEKGDSDSVEATMNKVRKNLDQIQSQLESQEREITRLLRQQRFRELQKSFAIWLESETKIKLTLDGLESADQQVFDDLFRMQEKLGLEFRSMQESTEDLYALAIELNKLESTSSKLLSALRLRTLQPAQQLAMQLVNQLESIVTPVEPEVKSEETSKQNTTGSKEPKSTQSKQIQITNFEVKLLQRMQEDILAETKRIEILRKQSTDPREIAELTKATTGLADLQSELISTLEKYLQEPRDPKGTKPEIPEIPKIDELPDLPEFDCGFEPEELINQEKDQPEPPTGKQQEKDGKDSSKKIETVRPFAPPGERSDNGKTSNGKKQGEDIGEGSDPIRNSLESIRSKMKSVQEMLIQQKLSGDNQQIQEDIIKELELFSTDQQKRSGDKSRDKNKKDSQKNGDQAATSSNTSQDPDAKSSEENGKNAGIQKRIDRIWGHLPDRLRKTELNIQSEQFLPKYRELIKAYFKRLASDPEIR